jgi:hypothetical protein
MNILEYINKKTNNLKSLIRSVKNDLATVQSLNQLNNYDSYIKIQDNLIQQGGVGPDDVVFRSSRNKNINLPIEKDESDINHKGTIYYYTKNNKAYIPKQNVPIPNDFITSDDVKLKLYEIQYYMNELNNKKNSLQTKLQFIQNIIIEIETINKNIQSLSKEIKKLKEEKEKAKTDKEKIEKEKAKTDKEKIEKEKAAKEEAEIKKAEENIKELKNLFNDAVTKEKNITELETKANNLLQKQKDIKKKLENEKQKLEDELKKNN